MRSNAPLTRIRRFHVALALLLGAAAAPRALADVALDRLLVQRGAAFVAAVNAPGEDALAQFVRDHLERRVVAEGLTPRFVAAVRRDFAMLGPIDRHMVQVLRDGALVFVLARRATTGAWQSFQFRVVAAEEHRLQLVFVAVAVEPMARPGTPIEAVETRAWLDRFMATMEVQQPFSGVALVVCGGKEVYSLVRGVAVAERNEQMGRGTRLGTASGSKLFTAVAVLQLAQAGKLSLESKLIEVVPSFPDREYAAAVTVRQLLTHTAGAGDYWDETYERGWHAITETPQLLPHVVRHLRETPVGEFSYSNSGYAILGAVIEAVSGETYFEYVRKHVFAPAGMSATGYPLRSKREAGVARAYLPEWQAGAVRPGVYLPAALGERGSAAGGAATTAEDMVVFVRALAGGRLLEPAWFRRMIEPQVADGTAADTWYGLGPAIDKQRGVLSWGHGGAGPGTQFELRVYPERDVVMAVMSNYDTIAAHELAVAVDDIVRGGGAAR
jgi:CubicO group peptidase (beta-lactamase class C family)